MVMFLQSLISSHAFQGMIQKTATNAHTVCWSLGHEHLQYVISSLPENGKFLHVVFNNAVCAV